MRHRSTRPVLDRLLPDVTPGMARRGLLLVAAVVGAIALGVAVAGPLADPAPGERTTVAVKSPLSSAAASWSVGTPLPDREPRPSRGEERSRTPAAPVEREPSSTAPTQQPSPSTDDRPSRTPSRTVTPSPTQNNQVGPTQTDQGGPSPGDDSAPDTSATTTAVEEEAWTVTSTADEGDSFECALDGGDFEPCEPTETFDDLEQGRHTLQVRAVDEGGNVDPSPTELVTNITGDVAD